MTEVRTSRARSMNREQLEQEFRDQADLLGLKTEVLSDGPIDAEVVFIGEGPGNQRFAIEVDDRLSGALVRCYGTSLHDFVLEDTTHIVLTWSNDRLVLVDTPTNVMKSIKTS